MSYHRIELIFSMTLGLGSCIGLFDDCWDDRLFAPFSQGHFGSSSKTISSILSTPSPTPAWQWPEVNVSEPS
jgi:hypothetical protein